ncbi:MAG: carbohydrate kinase family protein [Candidatus Korarchaeota archaeon]|nr:carbohydrate kinase family protein [Candidatus Korarchaeota archaeon]
MGTYAAVGHVTLDELLSTSEKLRLGGSVSYGSVFAAGLGYTSIIVSRMGRDLPEDLLEYLRRSGVNTSRIKRTCERTTRFMIKLEGASEASVLTAACDPILPEDLEGLRADVVHLGPVASEIQRETAEKALSIGNIVLLDLQGVVRSFGPDGRIELQGDRADEFSGLDLVVHANEAEARAITGVKEPIRAVERLSGMFWWASITLGRGGAVISSPEGLIVTKPPEIRHLDDVGAGDVFTAALGIALHRGYSFEDVARFATASAAASVLRRGPSAIPEDEIQDLMGQISVNWL